MRPDDDVSRTSDQKLQVLLWTVGAQMFEAPKHVLDRNDELMDILRLSPRSADK